MMSTRAGIDVIQLLILANNNDANKRAILDLIKTMNSSGSIDILKSLRYQAVVLKAYTQCMINEKVFLNNQLDKNSTCIIQRKFNRARLIDYAYSMYIYKGNYEFFQIEEFNNKDSVERRIQKDIENLYSLINTSKTQEQIIGEIIERNKSINDIKFSRTERTKLNVVLNDGTEVYSGVNTAETKSMIEAKFEMLGYTEPESMDLPIIGESQKYVLSAIKDDVNNLCPIKNIKALGYDSNGQFGFNNPISMEKDEDQYKKTFFIKILEVCENQLDFLEELLGALIVTINEPRETTMYLGKNIINLNKGHGYILIDAYKQQMKKLKEARPENIRTLGNIITSDCSGLITKQTIEKTSFERPGAKGYTDYCAAINSCKDLTERDKQLYKIDLTDDSGSQCQFVKKLADRKVIYDEGKCALPKSIIALIKLFAVLNPQDDMLHYYNSFFEMNLTAKEWNEFSEEIFNELSLVFCGYNTKILLENYTKVTCAVSQEVFEAITINPNVTEMAIKLNRGVYSYVLMSQHFGNIK